MEYLKEIKKFHRQVLQRHKGKPEGCSYKELAELETQVGLSLPEAYRQYLLWMGKDYHGIFVGSEFFITDVIENTKYLPELLADNNSDIRLPDNYLAFFSHQGYQMAWFNLPKENDDPLIYFFSEGQDDAATGKHRFTEFLDLQMRGLSACLGLYEE